MSEMQTEAVIASPPPPDRDEIVVQLFVKDCEQWGEMYRQNEEYWIDMYFCASAPVRLSVEDLIQALVRSRQKLREQLESP
jgi:hypothetical protein